MKQPPVLEIQMPLRCIECGRPIEVGRPDRKYCSSSCKNHWHNRRRYQGRELSEASILRILDNNRNILQRLYRMGISSLDKMTLAHLGYQADYITWHHKTGHREIFGCFDFLYEMTATRMRGLCCTKIQEKPNEE